MGEPCPAPLRVAMRSPLPFPCVPDRPYKILLVQVGTLSFSHPSFGVPVLFICLFSLLQKSCKGGDVSVLNPAQLGMSVLFILAFAKRDATQP